MVVIDDMRNFSAALAAIREGADPAQALQTHYFERASPGLAVFAKRRGMTAQQLAHAIVKRPRFYASLAAAWSDFRKPVKNISSALEGLRRIYPQTQFLPVYVFVGNFTGGGLADPAGALLAVEFYSYSPRIDTSEIGTLRSSLRRFEDIGFLAAHEIIHIQQAMAQGVERYMRLYDGSGTLLQWAIREGSADFLAELAAGGHTNPWAHAYGKANEPELWRQFKAEIKSTDVDDWMGSSRRAGWPSALGYYVGYRILQAYYSKAPDKPQAVRQIIAATDADAVLRESGYAAKFSR
jgi:hypothetical protein